MIDEAQRANANRQIRILARQMAEAAEADQARADREAAAEAARRRDTQIRAAEAADRQKGGRQ